MKEALRLMQAGQWGQALARVDHVLIAAPKDAQLLVLRAQCLMGLGLRAEAFAAAETGERYAPDNAVIRDAAGTLYSFGRDQRRALAAYDAAVALAPNHPQFRYNRASIRRFLGDLEGAEQDFDHAIAVNPKDYEAYKNRSDLRTQSAARNHLAELETAAAGEIADWRGEVQVRYALAKEYEDLERYPESFEQLTRAAKKRREHMRYEVSADLATVNWIIAAFPEGPKTPMASASADAPIFIIGLPRSGTTLVERILGSHSTLVSAGELDSFALSIVDAVRRKTGRAQLTRQDLVAYSAGLDFAALGNDYLRHARAVGAVAGRFIDKMPLNYLYCGLIHRALPQAKLVHLTRHPLAVCYAMYKTLFRDGYPFSYDLTEIGQYYLGYRQLMAHWNTTMPGSIYELNYETLIADQQGETRKLLTFCGLDWEEACVQFHQNPAASTTASAAQVRRPIYDSSLSQWRHYERQLNGLRQQLEAAGMKL
jgi:tetratricopeptide (TPR) repeat protein